MVAPASNKEMVRPTRHMLDIVQSRSLSGRERGRRTSPILTLQGGGKFMFFGSIPALVTPFLGGRVAEDTFRALVEWQIEQGSNALVPCGTTGEVATLTADEHRQLIATAVEVAKGRVPVIAGTGTYSTEASIERTRAA